MIVVRKMQRKDAEAVGALEQEIFSRPWSSQGFIDALNMRNTVFLVAEEEGRIIGYTGMYLSMEEGEITNVAVAETQRRRGVGGLLLKQIKNEAELRSVTRIILEVRVSNDSAIRLYERNGFQKRGIRRGFYDLPKEDACIMVYGQ